MNDEIEIMLPNGLTAEVNFHDALEAVVSKLNRKGLTEITVGDSLLTITKASPVSKESLFVDATSGILKLDWRPLETVVLSFSPLQGGFFKEFELKCDGKLFVEEFRIGRMSVYHSRDMKERIFLDRLNEVLKNLPLSMLAILPNQLCTLCLSNQDKKKSVSLEIKPIYNVTKS